MRLVALAVFLILSLPLYGDRVIVPVFAYIVYGAEGAFGSSLQITNVESREVTVRVVGMYQATRMAACDADVELAIRPGETQWLYPPDGCRGIFALELESSGRVLIHHEISTTRGWTSWHTQSVPPASSWIPAHRDAILPVVRFDLPSRPDPVGPFRSNLFVVNPNDEPLQFDLHIARHSEGTPSRDEHHVIAPRSLAVLRLEGVPDRWCDEPTGPQSLTVAPRCPATYDLIIRGDHPFYASVSTIAAGGDARFTAPAVLEP